MAPDRVAITFDKELTPGLVIDYDILVRISNDEYFMNNSGTAAGFVFTQPVVGFSDPNPGPDMVLQYQYQGEGIRGLTLIPVADFGGLPIT